MSLQLQSIRSNISQLSQQITNQLNNITGGDKPKLVTTIKIIGSGTVLFIANQILRKIWYTLYRKYKKYPPGVVHFEKRISHIFIYTNIESKVPLAYHILVVSSISLIFIHSLCHLAQSMVQLQCIN